jgi:hypothetical protein
VASDTAASDPGVGPASAPIDFLAPAQQPDELGRLGPYRILKMLGHGGMGVVFKAHDPRLGRMCALKTMLPEIAKKPGMKERFLREARAAAQLEHDHIIPIYQVDEDRGIPYIAMPFLKGVSLEDWLRQKQRGQAGTPLTQPQILKLAREIARGLAAAHEQGLVHRDIKPANMWLDATAGGRATILDFGLARFSDNAGQQNITQSGAIMGTPAYMAPEQALGQKLDGRADLFSLGVVLYRLCTGLLPFRGETPMSVLMALASCDPPPVGEVNPAISPPLSELVKQLLVKDPAKRIASAKEVVQTIQKIERELASAPTLAIEGRPPAAAVPQPSRRTAVGRASRSRKGLWIGLAAALFGGLVLAGWFVLRDRTGRGAARIAAPDNGRGEGVKNDKTGPPAATAPATLASERAAAEWIIANGSWATIFVDGKPVPVATVADLPKTPFELREINVNRNKKANDQTLACLQGLRNLRVAQITNCKATDKTLGYLKDSRQLRTLLLYATGITDAGLPLLEGFGQLEHLSLKQTAVTEAAVKRLATVLPRCRIEWNQGVIEPKTPPAGT